MPNTIWNSGDKTANMTLTGSSLIATCGSGINWVRAVDKQITGKFYWEVTATTSADNLSGIGIAGSASNLGVGFSNSGSIPSCGLVRVGTLVVNTNNAVTGFGSITSGMVICWAYDFTSRLVWVRVGAAGNWNTSATTNPATGVGGVSVLNLGGAIPAYPAFFAAAVGEAVTANFGDTAFVGAVPSGFTSGFTSGVTSSTNAIATQSALEHWATVAAALPSTQNINAMVLA